VAKAKKQLVMDVVPIGNAPKLVKWGLVTVDDVKKFIADGGVLTDIAGIGPEDAGEIVAALDK